MEEFDVSAFIDVRETMMNIAQAFVTRCCKADVTLSYRTMSPIRSTLRPKKTINGLIKDALLQAVVLLYFSVGITN